MSSNTLNFDKLEILSSGKDLNKFLQYLHLAKSAKKEGKKNACERLWRHTTAEATHHCGMLPGCTCSRHHGVKSLKYSPI